MTEKILILLGVLCVGYFAGIAVYAGLSSKFPFIWAAAGLCFWLLAWLFHQKFAVPTGVKIAGIFCVGSALVVFAAVEFLVIRSMMQKPDPDLDYIIVLGAQVKGNKPSLSLQYRIDEAAGYLRENPETKAILSGGKGSGEAISEARCMRQELEKMGVSGERLIEESRSTSTQENIAYSNELIQEDNKKESIKVGIVTNDFHIYRGTAIAKKKMDCEIYGIPAKSNTFLQLNYMVREFFGIVKDRIRGNL